MKTAKKNPSLIAAVKPPAGPVEILDKARPVKLGDIKPSKDNPRKTIDKEALQALAESIKTQGLLQPIVIRQVYGTGGYEIVAGERRWRAAKLAGLSEIPACIVKMTDEQARDARLVENDQREDISPLERAAAYQERLDAGQPIEELAKVVGKSVSSVRETLLLGRCPEALAEAVVDGRVPGSTAAIVCRIPNAKLRERITLQVLDGESWFDRNDIPPQLDRENRETLSFRETKSMIARMCMVELKQAPFDPADANLVKAAGTCADCPKRLGNLQKADPDGFDAAGRADVCMDPECYRAKTEAAAAVKVRAAKEEGRKVLSAGECNKLFHAQGTLSYSADYLDLDRPVNEYGADKRTYRQILKSELANGLGNKVVIGIDHDGRSHDLLPKKEAKGDLARHKITVHIYEPHKQKSPAEWKREQEARNAKAEKEGNIRRAVMARQFAAIAASSQTLWITKQATFMRLMARAFAVFSGGQEALCESLGIKRGNNWNESRKAVNAFIDKADLSALAKVIGMGLADYLRDVDEADVLEEFETLLNVDLESIEKVVRMELDPPIKVLKDEAAAVRKAGKKLLKAGAA